MLKIASPARFLSELLKAIKNKKVCPINFGHTSICRKLQNSGFLNTQAACNNLTYFKLFILVKITLD